jgi:hypothetical protein
MKNILVLLVGVAVLMTSSLAFSDDQSSGCGLGWQVTQRMSLLSSAVRTTTDWFLPNTFSMTSGTSGCAHHDIVKFRSSPRMQRSHFHQVQLFHPEPLSEDFRKFRERWNQLL